MVFALVGVIVAIVLIAHYSNTASRDCRWREDRRRTTSGDEQAYVCAACGAVAFTTNHKPPFDCRRPNSG